MQVRIVCTVLEKSAKSYSIVVYFTADSQICWDSGIYKILLAELYDKIEIVLSVTSHIICIVARCLINVLCLYQVMKKLQYFE